MDVALTDRTTTFDVNEEGEHELRAALLAIEASAERLNRHRGRLTDQQVDELTDALAHDVGRLRPLLEGQMAAARTFDLAEVLEPVVASARASASDVRCSVERERTVSDAMRDRLSERGGEHLPCGRAQ